MSNKGDFLMEWISVKNRLPEPKTMCIVSTDEGVRQSFFAPTKRFAITQLYGIKVTHWIPMPDLPESK